MCQSLSFFGAVPSWKTPPTRVQAPTSIGGSTSGRVEGMASADVGGLASVAPAGGGAAGGGGGVGIASGGGGAGGAAGGAPSGGVCASDGDAQVARTKARVTMSALHRARTVPSIIFFLTRDCWDTRPSS